MLFRSTSYIESELIHSYYTIWDESPHPDPEEISEGRFWEIQEIRNYIGTNTFTPNFEDEFQRLMDSGLLPVK